MSDADKLIVHVRTAVPASTSPSLSARITIAPTAPFSLHVGARDHYYFRDNPEKRVRYRTASTLQNSTSAAKWGIVAGEMMIENVCHSSLVAHGDEVRPTYSLIKYTIIASSFVSLSQIRSGIPSPRFTPNSTLDPGRCKVRRRAGGAVRSWIPFSQERPRRHLAAR